MAGAGQLELPFLTRACLHLQGLAQLSNQDHQPLACYERSVPGSQGSVPHCAEAKAPPRPGLFRGPDPSDQGGPELYPPEHRGCVCLALQAGLPAGAAFSFIR